MIETTVPCPSLFSTTDLFAQIQHLVMQLNSGKELNQISHLLSSATVLLGFDRFALLRPGRAHPGSESLLLSDFPAQWTNFLRQRLLPASSPLMAAGKRSATPFTWSGLDHPATADKTPSSLIADARDLGIGHGWTVPLHVPGEPTALCSFVALSGRQLPTDALPAAQYLACFAFESVRRISAAADRDKPRLTPRQRECIVLAARGKSDWAAGQILGLAPGTVHKYIEQAKSRMGVCSRTELVVRALHDGQISFEELLD